MGLFGKNKKEREKEYMNRLDVPLCLKEDFELIIDDVFTIMGVGTVVLIWSYHTAQTHEGCNFNGTDFILFSSAGSLCRFLSRIP